MKQKHINLLRAAANLLQSSQIQDENIKELRLAIGKERREYNRPSAVSAFESMIEFAKERNKNFLLQYADTIQEIAETKFTELIAEHFEEYNPVLNALDQYNKTCAAIKTA